jgi:hypothetical protein
LGGLFCFSVNTWIHNHHGGQVRRGGREPASRGWFKSPSRYEDFSNGKSFFSLDFFDYGFCFRAKSCNIYQKSNNYEFDPSIS